jgi:hypothetical protein
MKKILSILVWSLLSIQLLLGAQATLTLDRATITQGDAVTATLSATGDQIAFPKLTAIGPYPIESSRVSESFKLAFVNGQNTQVHQKQLRFTFFPDANVTIPALTVTIDGQKHTTQPMHVTVLPASQRTQDPQAFHLEMLVSRDRVYVGEPFLVQVVFYEPRQSSIAQAQYMPPSFDGFFVQASPQERLVNTPQGTEHVFDYILTPQKEGNLTLSAPAIKLGIQTLNGANDPWGLFASDIQWRSLRGTPKTVTVRPLPDAVDLVGTFRIQSRVSTQAARPNTPVSFTLTLEGKGGLDELDEPKLDLPGVTVYSDDANVSTRIEGGAIISRWQKTYTLIADRTFTIPALTFRAFDPKSGTIQTLKTDPIPVTIEGSAATTTPPSQPHVSPQTPQTPATPVASAAPKNQTTHPQTDSNASLFEDTAFYARKAAQNATTQWPWWVVVPAGLIGMILGWFARIWWRNRPRILDTITPKNYTIDEALDILYPHVDADAEIEQMVQTLYRAKRGENVTIDKNALHKIIQRVQ